MEGEPDLEFLWVVLEQARGERVGVSKAAFGAEIAKLAAGELRVFHAQTWSALQHLYGEWDFDGVAVWLECNLDTATCEWENVKARIAAEEAERRGVTGSSSVDVVGPALAYWIIGQGQRFYKRVARDLDAIAGSFDTHNYREIVDLLGLVERAWESCVHPAVFAKPIYEGSLVVDARSEDLDLVMPRLARLFNYGIGHKAWE